VQGEDKTQPGEEEDHLTVLAQRYQSPCEPADLARDSPTAEGSSGASRDIIAHMIEMAMCLFKVAAQLVFHAVTHTTLAANVLDSSTVTA
jgi:hypothetical protein